MEGRDFPAIIFLHQKRLFLLDEYAMIVVPHNQIEPDTENAFYLMVKTHPPFWHPLGMTINDCVAASEAMRFSCVASFGATHFLGR